MFEGTSSPGTSGTASAGRSCRRIASQEDRLGALGLVLNAAVLWTTCYLDAAMAALREPSAAAREYEIRDEDVAGLSRSSTPTSTCWAATPSGPPPRPTMPRQLRDPADAEEEDEPGEG
ncbi:Tn3 family transposase [Streptomyces sp. NPDC002588]|uniref:Tn3 family transposase n=1 Tax=Streptomyces sp. NPDC002588 TaxID=3154419 RepID=UPI00331DEFE1